MSSLIKEKGTLRINGFNSSQILSLLEAKHSGDAFIAECKNGETWGARDLLKLDAWVLRRTYSPLTTIGYEIKCTRADFEQDQKWVNYLDLCHQFYFVCPAGLIRSADLPSSVGLIWVSSTGKLHTKRKAERKQPDVDKLNRLLIYALMSRSKIVGNMNEIYNEEPPSRLQLLREVVERAKDRKELAYFVGGHVREAYKEARRIDLELTGRERDIKYFEERLALIGIHWDSKSNNWQDRNKAINEIQILGKQIDAMTLSNMGQVGRSLLQLVETIKKYRDSDS